MCSHNTLTFSLPALLVASRQDRKLDACHRPVTGNCQAELLEGSLHQCLKAAPQMESTGSAQVETRNPISKWQIRGKRQETRRGGIQSSPYGRAGQLAQGVCCQRRLPGREADQSAMLSLRPIQQGFSASAASGCVGFSSQSFKLPEFWELRSARLGAAEVEKHCPKAL